MIWNPIVQFKTNAVIFQIDLVHEREHTLRCISHINRLSLVPSTAATVRYRNKEKKVVEFNWNIDRLLGYLLNRHAFDYPVEGWWTKESW